jgi:undecaprenyl-diphosphatase
MEWFQQIDLHLLRLINQELTNPFLDWFFPRMAAPSHFVIPGLLLGGWLIWRGGSRGRLFLGLVLLALLIGDAVIVSGLKKTVNRPRPHEAVEGVRLVTKDEVTLSHPVGKKEGGRSFPSGHVCNNVALIMIVVSIYGKKMRWLYFWPLLMGWNRIYLGSHYPSDVLFSCLIAVAYTGFILFLFRRQIEGLQRVESER